MSLINTIRELFLGQDKKIKTPIFKFDKSSWGKEGRWYQTNPGWFKPALHYQHPTDIMNDYPEAIILGPSTGDPIDCGQANNFEETYPENIPEAS